MTITNKGDYLYSVGFETATLVAQAVQSDGTLTYVGGYTVGQISEGGEANSVIAYPPPVCASVAAQ